MPAKKTKAEKKAYVRVLGNGKEDGHYVSSGPAAAASKAASQMHKGKKGVWSEEIRVRQTGTTRIMAYRVRRVKLSEPYVSKIKGREIVREYKNEVKSLAKK